jgi:hypothetical protein
MIDDWGAGLLPALGDDAPSGLIGVWESVNRLQIF